MSYKQIKTSQFKKLVSEGTPIYVCPCKVHPSDDNPWIKPSQIDVSRFELNSRFGDFKAAMTRYRNEFYYYGNKETGLKPRFYVKIV